MLSFKCSVQHTRFVGESRIALFLKFMFWQSTRKYLQDEGCYHDAGKIQVLMRLLGEYGKEGRKVLIFSQV